MTRRVRTMRFAIVLSAAVSVATPAIAKPKRPTTCAQRVEILQGRLAEIPTHVGFGPPPMQLALPASKQSKEVTERGAIVDLRDKDLAFEGVLMKTTLDQGTAALIKRIELLERVIEADKAPVYLRIDSKTPVGRAMKLSCELSKNRTVHYVVANPDAPEPSYLPARPPEKVKQLIADVVAAPDPNRRSALLTKAFEEAITKCTALTDAVAAVSLTRPEERPRFLKRALIDGVRACECKGVDIDTLEALTIMITAPISKASYSIVPNLPCGQPKPFGLDPTASFGELVTAMEK